MRKSHTIWFWILVFLPIAAAPSYGLDLAAQDPTLGTYLAGVNENLTLIFDGSLNPATVTGANVKVRRVSDGSEVGATLSVTTTNLADDTIVIDPNTTLDFGRPYEFVIDEGLEDAGGTPFSGNYPFGQRFVCNIPNDLDLPDYSDPQNFDALVATANQYLGFDPTDPENTDESRYWKIPGMSITEAWKVTTGRPDVLIAVVDDGLESYGDDQIRTRLFLNIGEMPLPNVSGVPCGDYDCNGDGRINIEDYELDSRLLTHTGGDLPDPADCIAVFSDGADDDGNGLADDISGWDFFRGVNEALGVEEFPEGTHGGGRAEELVAIANDGVGEAPGVCPDCTVLAIRVGDAVMGEYNTMAAGLRYAHVMGAKVATVAMGSMNWNREAHQAVSDAYEDGMLTVAASGDEAGFHHIYPAAGEDVVSIKSIFPFPPMELLSVFPMESIAFTESYCTNFGAHTHLTVPAHHICTSEAVGMAGGIAGLIYSRGLDVGLDLTADEVKQIMTLSADDIKNRCVTLLTEGRCKPGFDEHFGYGRLNAKRALERLGDPDTGQNAEVPPVARLETPRWWEPINPLRTPEMTIYGQIGARGERVYYQLEYARGVEPDDSAFKVIAEGDTYTEVDGEIFTIRLDDLISPSELRLQPEEPNDKTVTFRLRAYYRNGINKIWGESRKAVSMFIDDDPRTGLMDGFPMDLGASGEGSVTLYDINHDYLGYLEMAVATSDGQIHVIEYNPSAKAWQEMDGFPVDVSGANPSFADSVIATPALGDLFGTGDVQIVVATMGGLVYAVWADGNNHNGGPFLPGFPVSADEPANETALAYAHGNAFVASPVLSDLDLDGMLEIVAAGYDQKAYAWKVDGGKGQAERMAGWPVLLSSRPEDDLVDHTKRCMGDPLPAQVLGSPAVFVIDPEHEDPDIGEHPAVVVPTSEVCSGEFLDSSRVYAVYWNGMENEKGPFLPDWPATPLSPLGNALPIPPLTIGQTNAPAAAYKDGDTLISTGGFFWFPELLHYDGGVLESETLPTSVNLTATAHGTFAPILNNGELQFMLPTVGALNCVDDHLYLETFNLMAWDLSEDEPTILFRKHMDDIVFFANPIVADLNGDYLPEVIMGSGGYLLHAFNANGEEPAGFPKMTGHWIIASPAVDDIDRDGSFEVVTMTHDGYLFAWETRGASCTEEDRNAQWNTYRHDEHNSGLYGNDATPPGMVTDLDARSTDKEFSFRLYLTAAGDDNRCGTVTDYDVRYSTSAEADLRDPEVFRTAPQATLTRKAFWPGGNEEVLSLVVEEQPAIFAVRAIDDQGLSSPISNISWVRPDEPDDDDDDSDSRVSGLVPIEDLPLPEIEEGEDIGCGC